MRAGPAIRTLVVTGLLLTFLTLPLRVVSAMRSGVVRRRTIRRVVHRHGHRRIVRRRVTEVRPRARVRLGGRRQIAGSLTNRDGQGIPGAEVQVLATVPGQPEQLVGVLHTDQAGDFTYTAAGSASRMLRFVYAGSPVIIPAASRVELTVPAVSTLRVSRHRVLNGHSVTFSGQVRTLPVPAGGKLVQVEVRVSASGRPSARFAPTRPGVGACATGLSAPGACSATASAWSFRARLVSIWRRRSSRFAYGSGAMMALEGR